MKPVSGTGLGFDDGHTGQGHGDGALSDPLSEDLLLGKQRLQISLAVRELGLDLGDLGHRAGPP